MSHINGLINFFLTRKFILRLDDIHPQMDLTKFNSLISLAEKYHIKTILGVIPSNLDKKLIKNKPNQDFWNLISRLQNLGHEICQHGYNHLYQSKSGGILKISNKSEFADLSLNIQEQKISKGLQILNKQNINPNTFMAPSHSFDSNTLLALKFKFKYITDGFSLYPYVKDNLIFVPQLFSTPKNIGFGVYTICIHSDNLDNEYLNNLEKHFKKNHKSYIKFQEAERYIPATFTTQILNKFFGLFFQSSLSFYRKLTKLIE